MDLDEQRKVMEKILLAGIDEQKRARRWKMFFMFAFLAYFIVLAVLFKTDDSEGADYTSTKEPHIALIDINWTIREQSLVQNTIKMLKKASENDNAVAIFIRINTPGGTTVQSRIIYEEILYWRGVNNKKVIYAVIEDLGASGGYLVASACNKIYSDPTSLVGSIGTAISSFGAVDLMKKIGIERRLITGGDMKGMLDPFSPLTEPTEEILKTLVDQSHEVFKADVLKHRNGTINVEDYPNVFSGQVWTGKDAKELGLIDEFGYVDSIARDEFSSLPTVTYKPKSSIFEFANNLKTSTQKVSSIASWVYNSLGFLTA